MEMNATVVERRRETDDLLILRVKPDQAGFAFKPGQFAVLGLPGSARRVESAGPERDPQPPERTIRRAYSIAAARDGWLEFYLKLVHGGGLTPRLFALRKGDRLWMGPKAAGGFFTLDAVPPDRNLILVATGTGLAPYVAMIRAAHKCGRGRRFTVIHGVRHEDSLTYRDELVSMAHDCETFDYIPAVSRPRPGGGWKGHVGRVQSVFEDGAVQADPKRDHVFLCGAPEMVEDMRKLLEKLGFRPHSPKEPGSIHVERYW